MLTFKRPFIWIKRFRKRCGYGVHSPSAFDFITSVIYEKAQYYAYDDIENSEQYRKVKAIQTIQTITKVNRLLFRLVNRIQPHNIIEVGPLSTSVLYLRAAKGNAEYVSFSTETDGPDIISKYITHHGTNFVFIRYKENQEIIKKVIELSFPKINKESVFVFEGICYDSSMRQLWHEIECNEHAITTYDLYDLGIVLFDSAKIKQHYKVNF